MIPFISRHIPTEAQRATLRPIYGEIYLPDRIDLERGRVDEQISELCPPQMREDGWSETTIAGVFPTWAVLELLRTGWTVIEFINEPSARARGQFVCRGAYIHEWEGSDWLDCPIPAAEQEDSPLLGGLRKE